MILILEILNYQNLTFQKFNGKVILCCVCDEENAGYFGTKVLAEKE